MVIKTMFSKQVNILWCIIVVIFASSAKVNCQDQNTSSSCVLDKIQSLESVRDPKCHATASRLEDFMYGTPLNELTRMKKVELQKKLILYIWNKATQLCEDSNVDTITTNVLENVINDIALFGRDSKGQWYVKTVKEIIYIDGNDLRQYSSVAYALRAMLSVEQDFLFNPSWNLKPMDSKSVDGVKLFIDVITLACLQKADKASREVNALVIDEELFEQTWNTLLEDSKEKIFLTAKYPQTPVTNENAEPYVTIKNIIKQKVNSYKAYNEISLPILLRNIQVYFARHRWPTEMAESDALKSYMIESLVLFCKDLIINSDKIAKDENQGFIRAAHLNKIIPLYLPFEANSFEDIIYFPNSPHSITIESYDLDAFRDSGIHWLILQYAIDDLTQKNILEPDPFAAELIVETVAQMALLVLRTTGEVSVSNGNRHIQISDMQMAFERIQKSISEYSSLVDNSSNTNNSIITSTHSETSKLRVFEDISDKVNIDFTHKSSDWLSRLIRSYVIKKDESLIKMAIPPAFGGSGVAAEDLNNDGWSDVVILGGMGAKIYLNKGDNSFEDITEETGVDLWENEKSSYAETRQILINDLDNDGWQDIVITLVDNQHKVYKNINGFTFEDVSQKTQLGGAGEVAGPATVIDYDNDGLLDIYIGYFGNYLNGILPTLSRNNQNGTPNRLFKNLGDFKFEEQQHMLEGDVDLGWTQAVGHSDINQDGWQDIIVGNDFGINAYYINQGNGYFKNKNKELHTDKPSYTMNVGSTDLNGDMFPDFYISNIVVMEKDEKYVNPTGETRMNFELQKMENIRTVEANDLFLSRVNSEGNVRFEKSNLIGRGYASTGWSWDADFFDFDNDGDEDIYCLNGMNDFRVYGSENPYYNSPDGTSTEVLYANSNREKNNFFVNNNGMLTDESDVIGGDLISNSRSATYLDFDKDGDLDILINNYHEKAVFLENSISNGNNWIAVRLVGDSNQKLNRDAIGSNIIVSGEDNFKIWREVKSTTGYLSVHPKEQYFGLGNLSTVDIVVRWPNGVTQNFNNIAANKHWIIDYNNGLIVDKSGESAKH